MCKIILKGLDKDRLTDWIQNADDKNKTDPVHSFIAAWIGFNHYYSTFAAQHVDDFNEWRIKYFKNQKGDKAEWMFLIHHDEFKRLFNRFKETEKELFENNIELPIIDELYVKSVPANRKGKLKFKELSEVELFESLYQIRNNLFHGSKNPVKNERDMELSKLSSHFMLPFLRALSESTYR